MKVWLLFSLLSLASGRTLMPHTGLTQDPKHMIHEAGLGTTVEIPRGGATILGITPDVAAKTFIFTGLSHIPSFIDPNLMPRLLTKSNLDNGYQVFALQSGSIAFFGVAIMTFLAYSTNSDVVTIAKFGNNDGKYTSDYAGIPQEPPKF